MNSKIFFKFSEILRNSTPAYATLSRCTQKKFLRQQIFIFCTAAFYLQWQWCHVGLLRELSFFGDYWRVIKLENIQAANYAETTVEWEQWAVADSDSE